MGWSIGFDVKWNRDIGYGVPCVCEHPDCSEEIDRGLSYVCGGEPYGGEDGCGLYFCGKHLVLGDKSENFVCSNCDEDKPPFTPKPDVAEWIEWKLTDESWQKWRDENPNEVIKMCQQVRIDL